MFYDSIKTKHAYHVTHSYAKRRSFPSHTIIKTDEIDREIRSPTDRQEAKQTDRQEDRQGSRNKTPYDGCVDASAVHTRAKSVESKITTIVTVTYWDQTPSLSLTLLFLTPG